jgi:hypothetical protein
VHILGKLDNLDQRVANSRLPPEMKECFHLLLLRMAAVDSTVTTSAYRELGPEEQDEPPTGEHYNDLWDSILDEINAATSK